jgi:hypothetical protein
MIPDLRRALVSAESVLVTTFWIFLQPHETGLMGHWRFWHILWCVPTMKRPAWESGFFWDAKDASENAMKRKSATGIGRIVMVTSWCLLASCRSLFPSCNVPTVALGISDCSSDNRLARSGLVLVDAYCKLPTRPRRAKRSFSVTASSGWVLRLGSMGIELIFRTYADWLRLMLLSGCWLTSIPVNVNAEIFLDPKGNFVSSA